MWLVSTGKALPTRSFNFWSSMSCHARAVAAVAVLLAVVSGGRHARVVSVVAALLRMHLHHLLCLTLHLGNMCFTRGCCLLATGFLRLVCLCCPLWLLTLLVPWLNLRPIWLQLKPHCRPGAAACLGLHYPLGKAQPMCSNAPPTTLQTTTPLSCWISVRLRREPSMLCACSRCGRPLHVSPNEPGHSGTTGSQSVAQLQALLADAQIHMIVLSHADKDHYALLPQVFDLSGGVPAPLANLARVVLGGKRNCYTGAIDAWLLALSAGGVTVETINNEQPCWNCGVLSPCPNNPGVTATVLAANQVC